MQHLPDGSLFCYHNPMHKRIWWIIGGISGVLLLAGLVTTLLIAQHHKNGSTLTPQALTTAQASASFPLFYAKTNSPSFQFVPASVSATSQAVLYSYQYDHDKTLAVSVQPIGNLNVDQFNPTSDFATTVGHAYIVDIDSRTTAAVVGSKSWALINAPDKISVSELTQFINSLRTIN